MVIKNLLFDYNETSGYLRFLEIGHNLQSHSSLSNIKEQLQNVSSIDINWGNNGL
jgi:hypothetical protein